MKKEAITSMYIISIVSSILLLSLCSCKTEGDVAGEAMYVNTYLNNLQKCGPDLVNIRLCDPDGTYQWICTGTEYKTSVNDKQYQGSLEKQYLWIKTKDKCQQEISN